MVITGSIASIQGVPAFGVYAATKAALRSFARSWAADLKGRDIRGNVVSLCVVVTPGYKSELKMSDEQIETYSEEVAETTPLGRVGEPEEIAKAVSFLASDDASYITGIGLLVEPTTQKEIKNRLLAAGLKPFMMEHGFCHSLYIKDPNGLTLEFSVDHEDSASIYAERASSAHRDLERWMSGERNTNNPWRPE